MNEARPLISIVIAVYNGEKYISRCFESIRSQTFPDVEILFVDGASTDGTVDFLKSHDNEISYWISEPDSGIYNAWNKVILKAKGEWILFLGSDDQLASSNVLANVAKELHDAKYSYNIVYGKVQFVDDQGKLLKILGKPWEEAQGMITQISLPHQAVFHNIRLFENHGLYDEQYQIAGDFEFMLRELKNNDAKFIDMVISRMQIGGISSNDSPAWKHIKERFRARHKHSISDMPWIMYRQGLGEIFFIIVEKIFGHGYARHVKSRYRILKERLFGVNNV
jgi:glycosyltransferase involved in cell wall biosynthesis